MKISNLQPDKKPSNRQEVFRAQQAFKTIKGWFSRKPEVDRMFVFQGGAPPLVVEHNVEKKKLDLTRMLPTRSAKVDYSYQQLAEDKPEYGMRKGEWTTVISIRNPAVMSLGAGEVLSRIMETPVAGNVQAAGFGTEVLIGTGVAVVGIGLYRMYQKADKLGNWIVTVSGKVDKQTMDNIVAGLTTTHVKEESLNISGKLGDIFRQDVAKPMKEAAGNYRFKEEDLYVEREETRTASDGTTTKQTVRRPRADLGDVISGRIKSIDAEMNEMAKAKIGAGEIAPGAVFKIDRAELVSRIKALGKDINNPEQLINLLNREIDKNIDKFVRENAIPKKEIAEAAKFMDSVDMKKFRKKFKELASDAAKGKENLELSKLEIFELKQKALWESMSVANRQAIGSFETFKEATTNLQPLLEETVRLQRKWFAPEWLIKMNAKARGLIVGGAFILGLAGLGYAASWIYEQATKPSPKIEQPQTPGAQGRQGQTGTTTATKAAQQVEISFGTLSQKRNVLGFASGQREGSEITVKASLLEPVPDNAEFYVFPYGGDQATNPRGCPTIAIVTGGDGRRMLGGGNFVGPNQNWIEMPNEPAELKLHVDPLKKTFYIEFRTMEGETGKTGTFSYSGADPGTPRLSGTYMAMAQRTDI